MLIDSRETRSGIPERLQALGVQFEMQELPVGDYLFGDRLVVERKSANDFVISILDGRLFGQAEQLANMAQRAVLVLEGSLAEIHSTIESEALLGALSALTIFFDIPVLSLPTVDLTARYLARVDKHVTNGLGYQIPLRPGKPKPDGALAQFLVEGLPEVGPERARKLLDHFGSSRAVFAADTTELCAVSGVGPKTAAAIVRALDFVPNSYRNTKTA